MEVVRQRRERPSSYDDAVAALAAYTPEISATNLSILYGQDFDAAEAAWEREKRHLDDLADAAHAQLDAHFHPVRGYGPDGEVVRERLEAAESDAYDRKLDALRRARSKARRRYGMTRKQRDRLRERVQRPRGRNRLDVADLELAPMRRPVAPVRCRTRPSGRSGRPGRRVVHRAACRVDADDGGGPEPEPEPDAVRVRRPEQSERRRPW